MDKTKKVPVKGRTCGEVFYTFPDTPYFVRTFNYGETQYIDFEELEKLLYTPGGEYLIRNSLIVAPDALEELGINVAPEYFYTEREITQLLETGTLDQLEDTLNFAPKGVIDLITQLSVKNKLFDTRKRKMIFEKTGFNIDGALEIEKALEDNPEEEEKTSAPARKAEPIKVTEPEKKKAIENKYGNAKVIEKK